MDDAPGRWNRRQRHIDTPVFWTGRLWLPESRGYSLRARPAENFRLVAAEALRDLERFLEMSFSADTFLIID